MNKELGKTPDASRMTWINDNQEAALFGVIGDYINQSKGAWHMWSPCSSFAANAWNTATGESLGVGVPSTPEHLTKSIINANGGTKFGILIPPTQVGPPQYGNF